jgi:hypothetical protein
LSEIAYKLIINIDRNGRISKENVALRLSLYVFLDGWNVKGICRKRPRIFFCRLIWVISSLSYQMGQASSIRCTQGKKELESRSSMPHDLDSQGVERELDPNKTTAKNGGTLRLLPLQLECYAFGAPVAAFKV